MHAPAPPQHLEIQTVAVVFNPTKVPDVARLVEQVEATFAQAGWSMPTWFETTAEDAGFGQAQAAAARGVQLVVACGGDGTVRECVRALVGTNIALGILPLGTGNLLARELEIPLDVEGAARLLTSGDRRVIDVGKAAGNTFLVMAGMGFDAQLVGDTSEGLKARIGVAAYVLSALRRLFEKPMRVKVTIDGQAPLVRHARCVLAGKVGHLPGGFRLADVQADDGRLAVVIVTPRSIGHWLRAAWALMTRKAHVPGIETHRARRVRIETAKVQRREVDGDEIDPGKSMDIEVIPHSLIVCAPRTRSKNAV